MNKDQIDEVQGGAPRVAAQSAQLRSIMCVENNRMSSINLF